MGFFWCGFFSGILKDLAFKGFGLDWIELRFFVNFWGIFGWWVCRPTMLRVLFWLFHQAFLLVQASSLRKRVSWKLGLLVLEQVCLIFSFFGISITYVVVYDFIMITCSFHCFLELISWDDFCWLMCTFVLLFWLKNWFLFELFVSRIRRSLVPIWTMVVGWNDCK